jgi:hypothetical protein
MESDIYSSGVMKALAEVRRLEVDPCSDANLRVAAFGVFVSKFMGRYNTMVWRKGFNDQYAEALLHLAGLYGLADNLRAVIDSDDNEVVVHQRRLFDKGYSNLVEHIGNLERALGFVYGRTYGRPLKYD